MRFHAIIPVLILLIAGNCAVAADLFVAAVQEAVVPVREAAAGDTDKKDKQPGGDKQASEGKEKAKDDKPKDGKDKAQDGKDKDKDKEKAKDEPPKCMHCGATCGLEAVCVCECGKKKKPKTEYEAKCDPICVPKCSGLPWPFSRCHRGGGCTDSCTACRTDPCRAWVRQRKTLVKETKDEEVSVIERKVKYVCCRCMGAGKTGCCGGGPAKHVGWWRDWLRWLPGYGAP